MDNKGKALVGLGIAAAIVALVVTAKKQPDGGGSGGGNINIHLYDQNGNLISSSIPTSRIQALVTNVTEGQTINAVISVVNNSYKLVGGQQIGIPATLTLNFAVSNIVADTEKQFSFNPGQSRNISSSDWSALSFTIPAGTGNITVSAQLIAPDGSILGNASANITVQGAAPVWSANINFV